MKSVDEHGIPVGWVGFIDGTFVLHPQSEQLRAKRTMSEKGWKYDKTTGKFTTNSPITLASHAQKLTMEAKRQCEEMAKRQQEWRSKYGTLSALNTDLPTPPGIVLRDYQKVGTIAIIENDKLLLADECGLGKTPQAITALNGMPETERVLIACPKHLALNWLDEWDKFSTREDLTIKLLTTKKTKKATAIRKEAVKSSGVFVVTYASATKLIELLKKAKWDLLICDEAHMIKNPKSARGKAFKLINNRAKRTLLVTATPIPNRVNEIFPLLQLLDWPDKFYPFTKRYCEGYQGDFGWSCDGASNLPELSHRLRGSVMVRRTQSEVLDSLPSVTHKLVRLAVDKGDVVAKKQLELLGFSSLEDLENINLGFFTSSIPIDVVVSLRIEMALHKKPQVVDYVMNIVGPEEPIVVFAYHLSVINAYQKAFEDKGLRVRIITGEVGAEERHQIVSEFQDGHLDVVIGNIMAMGTGLTMTRARHLVYAELDWSPGNIEQGNGRVIRVTQERAVFIHYLVAIDSIEAWIAKTLTRKDRVLNASLQ